MKKLISLALALIMVLSTMACLPLGTLAVDAGAAPVQQTLYAENFDGLEDGTYTAADLAYWLDWTVERGDPSAVIATVTNGELKIDTSASSQDYVFAIAKTVRFMDNHTIQYDLTAASCADATNGKFYFAAIYTGSYNADTGETTAIIPKVTYEGYHNLTYVVGGVIDEGKHSSEGYTIGGAGYEQARPESIPFSGGYGAYTTKATWTNVISADQNQVDVYANGGRMNSTETSNTYDKYQVADLLGDTAYLRVQLGRVAIFDNISIVSGADVITHDSNVVYEQNFDDITYDPETETAQDLGAKIGWTNLTASMGKDPTATDDDGKEIEVPTTFSIVNGMLDILNPYGAASLAPQIFIPEMERAKDQIVIEYTQMYVYKLEQGLDEDGKQLPALDVLGEYDGGDQPITFTMYGRRSDFYVKWEHTQKGFNKFTFKNGDKHSFNGGGLQQVRPQNVPYSHVVSGYQYTDQGGSHYNIYNSLDRVKVIMDKTDGVEIYFNGALVWYLNASQLAAWVNTSNSNGPEHMLGHVLKMTIPAGCHVRLDDMKVTLDPEEVPELLITEVASSVNDKDEFEYVEVYNNASERVNIYDYVLVTQTITDSFKSDIKQQQEIDAANKKGSRVNIPGVLTMYPDAHTYKSPADAKTGISAYSVTLENPSYEDGWLEPGEVAMIWNTANAMHTDSYTAPKPNREEWSYTDADFRTEVGLDESIKVFKSYNDYNQTLTNTGRYFVGIGYRSAYQPGYMPMYQRGDETIVPTVSSYKNLVSYVYMLIDGAFDPNPPDVIDGNGKKVYGSSLAVGAQMTINEEKVFAYPIGSGWAYRSNYSDLLDPKTGGPCTLISAQFVYGLNNAGHEGLCIDGDNVETVADVTPGVVLDVQKRAMSFKVDSYKAETKYLGDEVDFTNYQDDGFKSLFMNVNGELRFENFTQTLTEDVTVVRVGMKLATESKGISYAGDKAVITWTTPISGSDLDSLLEYMDMGILRDVKLGVLISENADLSDATILVERSENWLDGLVESAAGVYALDAVCAFEAEAYDTEYTVAAYITVTLLNGQTVTVYADAATGSVMEMASALRDAGYVGADDATKTWIDSILPPVVTE